MLHVPLYFIQALSESVSNVFLLTGGAQSQALSIHSFPSFPLPSILPPCSCFTNRSLLQGKEQFSGLLKKDPMQRNGSIADAKDIINHPFFQNIKWDDLYHKWNSIKGTASFVEMIDKFFDCMNVHNFSHGVHEHKHFQMPYRKRGGQATYVLTDSHRKS